MTARLTAAEARALGITAPTAKKARTTRKTGKGPYATRCCTCREEFHTAAAESRHDPTHHRFELIL